MDEIYDLKADPYEMENLIHKASAARALTDMKLEMERLLKGTGAVK